MNKTCLQARLRAVLNRELISNLLKEYFDQKGLSDNMDIKIHPPVLQDLPFRIAQLTGKVEVVPHLEDIDPNSGVAKLAWNLYVLGHKRMFLGESTHTSLVDVASPVGGPMDGARNPLAATPNRIIKFITDQLGSSKGGDLDDSKIVNRQSMAPGAFSIRGQSDASRFFSKYPRY